LDSTLKIAVVVGVAILLSGCDEGEEHALVQCELNALPTYKDGWQTVGAKSGGYQNYIYTCMKVAGFDGNIRPNKCGAGFFPEHNPYCYSPIENVSYLLWRVRITVFEGGLIGQGY
jgi:hypothetical protein